MELVVLLAVVVQLCGSVHGELELLQVFNIWRHGDRAPVRMFSSAEAAAHPLFKNGLKNLTDQGIQHAFHMGQFIKYKYGDFLSTPDQVHIRSTSHDRTIRTAQEAMRAVFGDQKVELEVAEGEDWMLKPSYMHCPVLQQLQEAKCPNFVQFPSDYATNFDSYEYDLFRCAGLDKKLKYFGPGKWSFRLMESILNEALNNYLFLGTNVTDGHVREARKMYRKVQRITLGIGPYHEPELLRVYSGELLFDITSKMKAQIDCDKTESCGPIIFHGYSSQDLQIFPMLEIFNSTRAAVGGDAPLYTSGIFIELWAGDDYDYYVKVFYRQDYSDNLVELNQYLPHCRGKAFCDFEDFVYGISDFITSSNQLACQDIDRIRYRLEQIGKGTIDGVVQVDHVRLDDEDDDAQRQRNAAALGWLPTGFNIYALALLIYFYRLI
ncbi:unnamed protein product, partial [Mesorhabditis spiculigera]